MKALNYGHMILSLVLIFFLGGRKEKTVELNILPGIQNAVSSSSFKFNECERTSADFRISDVDITEVDDFSFDFPDISDGIVNDIPVIVGELFFKESPVSSELSIPFYILYHSFRIPTT